VYFRLGAAAKRSDDAALKGPDWLAKAASPLRFAAAQKK